jgi:hypothetical protein
MRQTAKLTAAQMTAFYEKVPCANDAPHDELYAALASAGYAWNSASGKWEKSKRPIRTDGTASQSIFSDDDNQPSGVYRLRVMAHPDEVDNIVRNFQRQIGGVVEVSDHYPNRKGGGVRVYLTCKVNWDEPRKR